jgi:hypothetical protein
MDKLVSLLYNKEKASYAFFGKNVNKSVHFFVIKFIFRYQDLVEIYSVFAERL